jgi:cell division protein DivIC
MKAKTRERNSRGSILLRPKTMIALGLFGFILISFVPQYFRIQTMNGELSQLRHELKTLQKQNQTLKGDIGRLETDGEIERIAREELGLVKPGEEVILQARPGQAVPLQGDRGQNLRD